MSCVSGTVDKIEGDFEAGGDSRSDSDFTPGWISAIFELVARNKRRLWARFYPQKRNSVNDVVQPAE